MGDRQETSEKRMLSSFLLLTGALAPPASALVLRRATSGIRCMPQAGLFDMFKESEAQKAAKEEAWRAQQEVLRRRRNPDAMDEYMTESANRRAEASGSD